MDANNSQSPLRRKRFDAGDPSLRDLAARAAQSIDAGTISRLERGEMTMSFGHASALAPLFGLTAGDLLKEMADWYTSRAEVDLGTTADIQAEIEANASSAASPREAA
jgi:transcriptional regulator with XRE-family HTH domain